MKPSTVAVRPLRRAASFAAVLATLAAGCASNTEEPEQTPAATSTSRVALGGSETTFCGVSLGYSDPVIIDAVDKTEIELPLGPGTYYVRVSNECEHGASTVTVVPADGAVIQEWLPQRNNVGLVKIDVLRPTGEIHVLTADRSTPRVVKFHA